ncbi:MAG: hypothetical protein ABIT71_06490 [Vicinamibacteraceae bacterium]
MAPLLLLAAALSGVLGAALEDVDPPVATDADLRLVTTAPTRLMVGEFLTVRTTVTARHRVKLCDRDVAIDVDAGHGFVEHVEAFAAVVCMFGGSDLGPGRSFVVESTVGLEALDPPSDLSGAASINASARFAFDRPGLYRIRARHGDAVSGVIIVEAVAPSGEDARLLAALRQQPGVLSGFGVADDALRSEGRRLLVEFGTRPLLLPFIRHLQGSADVGRH